jgi:osmoprotectant transport system substrate-binding protein
MKTPAIVLATVAIALSGCGSGDGSGGKADQPGKGKPPVTIATKNFTEEYILGQLYTQALRAKGFTVVLKENVGSSEIVDRALADGVIDMYPEYIGVIAQELARATRRASTPTPTPCVPTSLASTTSGRPRT